MSSYDWDKVPPHSEAHNFCRKSAHPDLKIEPAGYAPGESSRKVPEQYGDFMGDLIKKYAFEGGKPGPSNGTFWFQYEGSRAAAKDVLKSYLHVDDQGAEDILCDNFEKTWKYTDVNNSGKIEADRMPGFFRDLVG